MKKVTVLLFILMFLLELSFVRGHGNIIYNIDLDFDEELKSNVIKSAQSHLNIDEEPIQFDFDRELIVAKFDRELEYSVEINPIDYSVFGFRDDSLLTKGDKIKFEKEERKKIAKKVFDNLPEEYKSELKYGEEKKLYSGSFKHSWYRHVDNIYVSGDHLEVEVDPYDGDVIAWRLSIFFYQKSQLKTNPAITYQVAQKVALIRFDAEPLDFNPILIIDKNKPIWITKVKSLYPHFVAVDALDGNVLYSGSLRADLPNDYDYGREIGVTETDFISGIYKN